MAKLAMRAAVEGRQRVRIHTPQIITRVLALGVNNRLTISCYNPSPAGEACGTCNACLLQLKGLAENGLADPAAYRVDD